MFMAASTNQNTLRSAFLTQKSKAMCLYKAIYVNK